MSVSLKLTKKPQRQIYYDSKTKYHSTDIYLFSLFHFICLSYFSSWSEIASHLLQLHGILNLFIVKSASTLNLCLLPYSCIHIFFFFARISLFQSLQKLDPLNMDQWDEFFINQNAKFLIFHCKT